MSKTKPPTEPPHPPPPEPPSARTAAPPPGPPRRIPVTRGRARPATDLGEPRDLGPLIRVRALETGFVDNIRRRENDVFDVHTAEFSERWMEVVDGDTPERLTGPKKALTEFHDRTLAERSSRAIGSAHDPLGTDATSRRV